ncbi:copper amine oxidase N-terminal domain-containing protein [Brevibacillus brevis]|uniref:copper amine oxidase N-terminal domain-containing protein n=1 Tax=Brevibacillus brevis TaxID=1393 RepID=UPI001F5B21AC|nr:copper amine oxidase N-terminal domain-containing protein [Brevibacillus brevis]
MKKAISTSLVAILLATSVPAALAANLENKGNEKGKPEVKAEAKDKSKETSVKESDTDTDSDDENSTEASTETNIKDVKLKKQLIELRQELKHTAEITEDQKAKYEQLVADLEKTTDKHGALDVQLELLQRTYQKGDHTPFKKLGELLEDTGSTEVKAFVDGKQVKADVAPFVKGGRALVPVRAISSALKAEVNWKPETRSVEITRGEKSITLYLDKKEATVDGKTISLDTAPVLKNGRVFLPLRFISEQLNAK